MPADSPIPDIPGRPIDAELENALRKRICRVIGINGSRFIGAQPISFTRDSLDELQTENYFVSEKSDGVRVMLFCIIDDNRRPQVYLVDRKNKFSYVPQLRFPVLNPQKVYRNDTIIDHNDTIVDGELVIDREPDGTLVTRYLAFDLLAYNGNNITAKPLTSRLARLQCEFVTPYRDMMEWATENNSRFVNSQPFKVTVKQMNLSYGIEKMFKEVVPNLKHGSDGLIFTSSVAPYVPSTNTKMLKWKPPSENTIDFKLSLQFPTKNGSQDRSRKPEFVLLEWHGGNNYVVWGRMTVEDEQWEEWKSSSTRLDNRIVEVNFKPQERTWHFFRFRDDKEHGNHTSVVQKVVRSIRDGVEADELLEAQDTIRAAWKERERIAHERERKEKESAAKGH
ncbi:mRNA capping enzyme, catalytic domain-containing protein [Mortierella sp. GBAus27b]|nr:mRNA capping enzyme, catalytic domain-containing protein [Mortierella sp. GBAus27b]